MSFEASIRGDSDTEVKSLFQAAKKRKEDAMKYHLIAELLEGETINLTKSPQMYEAVNREKMDFETLLKLHPEQVQETIEYVKMRKAEQNGIWWNKDSKAKHGEKGAIPPCCYFARPVWYWKNKALVNSFFNTFSKFRISESPL